MKKENLYYLIAGIIFITCICLFFSNKNTLGILSLMLSSLCLVIALYKDIDNIEY